MAPDVTCVLLVFNEKDNVAPLTEAVLATFDKNGIDGEVLLGDDGSTDGSYEVCEELSGRYDRVRVFHHKADPEHGHPIDNWNRAWTILHGFQKARGDIVVVMDGDRQYEPGEIPLLIRKMEEGWDVVSGWRQRRADSGWRRLQSRTYNRVFIRGLLGMDINDQNSGLKAFRRDLALRMPFDPRGYRGVHRFILPIAYVAGATITEVPISHYDRPAGKSYIKTMKVPFIFLSDLLLRFYPRFRGPLSKLRKLRRRLGRMPSPKDRELVIKNVGRSFFNQPKW